MVLETTGAVNNEGMEVLRQLFRFAAKHQGQQLSVYCGRAWALTFSLVSQCFLNRAGSLAAIEKDIDFLSRDFKLPLPFSPAPWQLLSQSFICVVLEPYV